MTFACLLRLGLTYFGACALKPDTISDSNHVDVSQSDRIGYVLTFGGERWLSTKRALEEVGIAAVPISPVPFDSEDMVRYEHTHPDATMKDRKVYNNMISFWHMLDLASMNSSTKWTYIFEDDIAVNPGVPKDKVLDLLGSAEAKAVELDDDLLYGGVCLHDHSPHGEHWPKDGLLTEYTAGRCAHAWAVAPGKASKVRSNAEYISKHPRPVTTFNPGHDDLYFDCQLEVMALNAKHGGLVTPAANKCWPHAKHCGVFVQDRNAFPTSIGKGKEIAWDADGMYYSAMGPAFPNKSDPYWS